MCVQWHALACLHLPVAAAAAARLTTLYPTLHHSHPPLYRPLSLARSRRHHTLCSAAFHCTVMPLQLLQARLSRCNILLFFSFCTVHHTSYSRVGAVLPVAMTAKVAPLLDEAPVVSPATAASTAAAAAASGTVGVLLPRSLLLMLSTAMQGQAILGKRLLLS
jgi:hypothetical protein